MQRFFREGLGSGRVDSRYTPIPRELALALADPKRQASVEDIDYADNVVLVGCEPLDDAPILDLRVRKAINRHGAKLTVATERPSALDSAATTVIRAHDLGSVTLTGDVVVIWHERIGAEAAAALLALEGAKLLEIPAHANGRGVREAGALRESGPGYVPLEVGERAWPSAFWLWQVDPVREVTPRADADAALARAELVIATALTLTEGIAAHADVVFPAESSAEKEGTVVHPDGRVQRLRAAIKHPGEVRAGWQVISDVAKRTGLDLGVLTSGMAFKQLVEAVPFYAGLTLEAIGGQGVRWPATDAAAGFPSVEAPVTATFAPAAGDDGTEKVFTNELRIVSYRPMFASPEVEVSPALRFAIEHQVALLAPEDASRLGIIDGGPVRLGEISCPAQIKTGVLPGTVVLKDGLALDSAGELTGLFVKVEPV